MTSIAPPRHGTSLPVTTIIAVCALGITQILAWGTSFYALGTLGKPVAEATGWANTFVFGGFTIAVLASSVISTPAGWAIDRWGARAVMTLGYVALAASLYALSFVGDVWGWLAVWMVIGIAMRLTLYDAAFAALVQIDPANGRRAIAYLTLFGGFASTVGWPAGHWLNEAIGWRETFVVYAVTNLLINAPLAWFALPSRSEIPAAHAATTASTKPGAKAAPAPLEGRARTIAMILFSVVMSANAFTFGVGAIHLVGVIEASGVAVATAVALSAWKGVAQVAGRVWELIWGHNLQPMMLARIAIGLLPIAFAVLLMATGDAMTALAFTLIFGASNGLVTIVRGAVPLALFGPVGYGTILGILATPVLLFNAISPLVFTWIVEAGGYRTGTWVLLGAGIAASLSMEVLATWYRRQTRAS